ncbi:MAG TPA: type III-A CRISPR-associated protein Cas10/Csm1, partial [Fibrobacteres bacterium]|nr:type III-A CRISPR-associated protein Cas10/Csm1 [Fibrobacterota bacterium]
RGQVGTVNAGYDHALWTLAFLEDNDIRDKLNCFISNYTAFENAACLHHNPMKDEIEQLIVTYADRTSAGMDRFKDRPGETEDQKNKKGFRYYQQPLCSLFSELKKEEDACLPEPQYYEPASLHDLNAIFSQTKEESIGDKYESIGKSFKDEFLKIESKDKNHFLETIVSLLKKWLWAIPSSTMETPADIPLCDHLTSTAALSACMAAQSEQQVNGNPAESTFLCVSGDVGGIQKFIFTLDGESKKNAAKLFRGRSFFVSLITRLCADHIAKNAGVPTLCRIMEAGGHFSVLLPNTDKSRKSLFEVKHQIQKWLYDSFFGQLMLHIDNGVECGFRDFQLKNFKSLLQKISESISSEKKRPFAFIAPNESLFWMANDEKYKEYMEHGLCPVCGREPASGNRDERHPGVICKRFIEWGKELPKADFFTISEKSADDSLLGLYWIDFDKDIQNGNTFILNNYKTGQSHPEKISAEFSYACNKPEPEVDDDDTKDETVSFTFEQIAQRAEGLKALAVLKADVDNMGYLFNFGFFDRHSLARHTGLSRMLNSFFTEYVSQEISNNYPNVYTLFAGGDDLCLIGPWSDMVKLAPEVNKKFGEFTGNNNAVTLSAAVTLFQKNYPVNRAVDEAEGDLYRAKNSGRDCLCSFGCVMNWRNELKQQYEFVENWEKFIDSQKDEDGRELKMQTMLYRFLKYNLDSEFHVRTRI